MSDAAQLTLTWVDDSEGQATFSIERKTGTTGTYAEIAQQSAGVVSYYRVRAFNGAGASAYSNEACGSPGGSFTRQTRCLRRRAPTRPGAVGVSPAFAADPDVLFLVAVLGISTHISVRQRMLPVCHHDRRSESLHSPRLPEGR
jgi:hypothetical protein